MRHMLEKDNRAVIDDGVDARELAEEGNQYGNRQRLPKRRIQQVSALFRNRGTDVFNFSRGSLRTHDLREKAFRFLFSAFLHQPAWTLGNEKQRQQEKYGRNGS